MADSTTFQLFIAALAFAAAATLAARFARKSRSGSEGEARGGSDSRDRKEH